MAQWNGLATQLLRAELNSTLFNMSPALSLFMGKGRTGSYFRPGSASLLMEQAARGNRAAKAMLSRVTGRYAEIKFHTQNQGGTAVGTRTGNTPTVSNIDIMDTFRIGWTKMMTPIQIPAADVDLINTGSEKSGDITRDYMQAAAEDHRDQLIAQLFTGFPSSQTVDDSSAYWTSAIGLKFALYDGSTSITGYTAGTHKTYGGRDRSASGYAELRPGYLNGTAGVKFSFSLIDDANKQVSKKREGGLDVVLVNHDLFYDTILKIAKVEGAATIIHSGGNLPAIGMVGFRKDVIQYRQTYIIPDPNVPAGSDSGKSFMFGLTLEDWDFEVNPANDFAVSPLKYAGLPLGGPDAYQSMVTTEYRFYCRKPKRQAIWTDVS